MQERNKDNGSRIYMDIMTRKILSSIYVTKTNIMYWSVFLSSSGGGDMVKGV